MTSYRELLRPVFAGRRVLLVGGPVQGKTPIVALLNELGAAGCLVVGSMGTGAEPDAECVLVAVTAADMVAEFRRWEALYADPPDEVRAAVARFDPDLVLLQPFDASTTFDGRPGFGARRPEWTALEDKTVIDAFWDSIGVARPPSRVVPVEDLSDEPFGTVWAGDASDGFHGGGVLVHWVRDERDAATAIAAFTGRCRTARVAPFLEGVPCGVHGFVTGTGVAVFRPVELVTLRSPTPPALRYAGVSTTWDPPPERREELREVARVVGEALAERVGYRGAFTVDGIMTADGFRPTELNPRFGAGLSYVLLAGLPLMLLHQAAIAGAVEVDPVELEARVLEIGDGERIAAGWCVLPGRQVEGQVDLEGGRALARELRPGHARRRHRAAGRSGGALRGAGAHGSRRRARPRSRPAVARSAV